MTTGKLANIPVSSQTVFNKARKDKFLCILTLPKILRDYNSPLLTQRSKELVQLESLQFSVWGTVVPEINIPEQTLRVYGQPYKVTSQSREAYPPITVSFTIDNLFNNYWILWKWLALLNDPKDSGMDEYFGQYEPGRKLSNNTFKMRDRLYNINNKLQKNKNNLDTVQSKDLSIQEIRMKNDFLDYQTIITIFSIDEYNQKSVKFNYTNAFITNLGGITYNYRDPDELESSFQFAFSQMDISLVDNNV